MTWLLKNDPVRYHECKDDKTFDWIPNRIPALRPIPLHHGIENADSTTHTC